MEKIKYWGTDLWCGIVSFFCWFTPEHCEQISSILGMLSNFLGTIIAIPTLIFITIPKVRQSPVFKKIVGKNDQK